MNPAGNTPTSHLATGWPILVLTLPPAAATPHGSCLASPRFVTSDNLIIVLYVFTSVIVEFHVFSAAVPTPGTTHLLSQRAAIAPTLLWNEKYGNYMKYIKSLLFRTKGEVRTCKSTLTPNQLWRYNTLITPHWLVIKLYMAYMRGVCWLLYHCIVIINYEWSYYQAYL